MQNAQLWHSKVGIWTTVLFIAQQISNPVSDMIKSKNNDSHLEEMYIPSLSYLHTNCFVTLEQHNLNIFLIC